MAQLTDTSNFAHAAEKRGWMGALLMIAITAILAVLLVFPGFLAAVFSRAGCQVHMMEDSWVYFDPHAGISILDLENHMRAPEMILYPASKLMEHSGAIRRFYAWQYRLAGGQMIRGEIDIN